MRESTRNFVIIAHIDHGKSTLADRFLEVTGTVPPRQMKPQYLDQLELERERGITIKMAPVRMRYSLQGISYTLNLIDTPGHSDFSYEVSRALAAVEGAILLVDATQGVQAQTLANYEAASRAGLAVVGAVNKVDVAGPEQVAVASADLSRLIGKDPAAIMKVSGKTGEGVHELLRAVIREIPDPKPGILEGGVSRALIFDSLYDEHKGVVAFLRMFDGEFRNGDEALLLATGVSFRIKELGHFAPKFFPDDSIEAGQIGYCATGVKNPNQLKIGDTVLARRGESARRGKEEPGACALPGYREPKPVVFASFYPEAADDYDALRQALEKLHLTDAALTFEPDASEVLGRGFKGGFLGRLHFEIAAERLAREFHVMTTHSFPSVAYRVRAGRRGGGADGVGKEWVVVTNPKDFPADYLEAMEPMTRVEIVTPLKFLSSVLGLKEMFRFSNIATEHFGSRVVIRANLPLADLIRDLDDKLKSVSEGFASLNYEVTGYETADVEKLEVLVAGQTVPGLTRILPRGDLEREARRTVERLKELLPRQQFAQALQAAAGGRIIARETIPALKKDVTGYLYGGDRTRKMKLWKKQQEGKKKLKSMASHGPVKIPAAVFKELLKK